MLHIEPDQVVLVDVGKPGGVDGRGGQGGRDGDQHGGQSVLCGGLGGESEEPLRHTRQEGEVKEDL